MHRPVAQLVSSRRGKWVVVAFWIVVLAVAGPLASKLTGAQSNEAVSWLPGDAESTQALEAQADFISTNTIPSVIVYAREGGLTAADQAAAADDAAYFTQEFDNIDGEVVGPIPSEDGEALQILVPLDLGADGWELIPPFVEDMREQAADGPDGLDTHVTGPGGLAADSAEAFAGIDGTLLTATLSVVIVILLLTYRSPVLWMLPILSAVVALVCAQAVVYLIADAGLTVNAQSSGILTVLVIGAGTDYALLLVARYREELRLHEDRHEAMAEALYRAGPAIIASAGTVVLGMLCLLAADMNSTQGLGPVAAVGVAVGLLVMITLLPALLVIVGRWIFWPVRPTFGSPEPTTTGLWARVGALISPRPRATWVVTTMLLLAASVGVIGLNANGLTQAQGFRSEPDSITGEQVAQQHFPGGAGSPLVVVTDAAAAEAVAAELQSTEGIAAVDEPVTIGDRTLLQATLADAPDSDEAYATVDRVRASTDNVEGTDALVGGTSAVTLDVQRASQRDNQVVIPLVLVVVLVILAVLLRAIVAPLLLIATVVVSFGAALGLSALAFEYLFDMPAADSSFPLFVFVFLVALGIDYNIFLMTRVREEAIDHGTRAGALIGLSATGGVITSAGFVLAATFAVLGTLPLTFLFQLGFAVALGVLLDTIIVRSVLVTALTLDIGPRMWWPSALSRRPEEPAEPQAPQSQVVQRVG